MNACSQLKSFSRLMYKRIRMYFTDPQHRKEFEAWYFEKYGKKYEWKYVDFRICNEEGESK